MRKSFFSHEPVNPTTVENSLEPDTWDFENVDIDIKIEKEILPYLDDSLKVPEDLVLLDVAFAIDALLFSSEESLISLLTKEDLLPASMFIETTYDVIKDALDRGLVKKDAPWFKLLNNKMISLSLYVAGLSDEKLLKMTREKYYFELSKKHPSLPNNDEVDY